MDDINDKLEKWLMKFDPSFAIQLIDNSLDEMMSFLDEYPSDHQKIIDFFMGRILFNNKKNLFLAKMKDKETVFIEKIGSILNNCKVISIVFENFLAYFQNESNKKIDDNMDIFRQNLFSSFFVEFMTDSNLERILNNILENSSNQLLESQINKLMKVPLIFSNYSQNFSKKMSSEQFYKILLTKIENMDNFRNNLSLSIHFINKLTFNGLIGNVLNDFFIKKIRYIF